MWKLVQGEVQFITLYKVGKHKMQQIWWESNTIKKMFYQYMIRIITKPTFPFDMNLIFDIDLSFRLKFYPLHVTLHLWTPQGEGEGEEEGSLLAQRLQDLQLTKSRKTEIQLNNIQLQNEWRKLEDFSTIIHSIIGCFAFICLLKINQMFTPIFFFLYNLHMFLSTNIMLI